MEGPQRRHAADEPPRVCKLLLRVHKAIGRQVRFDVTTDAKQRKKVRVE